ncbi:unnamed protein product, partial [Bubo scandiacus]
MRSPLSLLFSRLNNPRSLSCSSYDMCSRPFTSFVALLWTRSSNSLSFLYHTCLDAGLDMVGFLGCKCTLLAHSQCSIHKYLQVLLCRAALNPLIAQTVFVLGIALTQVQDLALGLVEFHEFYMQAQVSSLSRSLWMASFRPV